MPQWRQPPPRLSRQMCRSRQRPLWPLPLLLRLQLARAQLQLRRRHLQWQPRRQPEQPQQRQPRRQMPPRRRPPPMPGAWPLAPTSWEDRCVVQGGGAAHAWLAQYQLM